MPSPAQSGGIFPRIPTNQPLLQPEGCQVKSVLGAHQSFLRIFADLDNVRPLTYKRFRQRTAVDEEERSSSKVHPTLVVQDGL